MFGMIGKLRARVDERERLAAILVESTRALPGCLSYIIARDVSDPDVLWITEVWESEEKHKASLELPAVKAAIDHARPLIHGFDTRIPIDPVGGIGVALRGPFKAA